MTEEEIIAKRLEDKDEPFGLSDAQKIAEEEAKERAIYGRYWVWDQYFNDRNKEQWLDSAE